MGSENDEAVEIFNFSVAVVLILSTPEVPCGALTRITDT